LADNDLRQKIIKMSRLLNDDAIAKALNITPEAVREIRDGEAEVKHIEHTRGKTPAIMVNSTKPTYRQKIISVWRAKGGTGCTAVAMNLAKLISESVDSVALLDFNFQVGPSDLTYYLDLPAEPNLLHFQQGYGIDSFCVKDGNLYVLQAPYNRYQLNDIPKTVNEIFAYCRKAFDAVICDLPNTDEDYVKDAIENSNTIVITAEGTCAEILRLEIKAKSFKNKNKIALVSSDEAGRIKEVLETHSTIKMPYDKNLCEALENQAFCKKNSPFGKTMARVKEEIYEQKSKGLLGRLASFKK